MLEKFELFTYLPAEMQEATSPYLFGPDLAKFSMAAHLYKDLFGSKLNVFKLLHYGVRSQRNAVKAITNNEIKLIFQRAKVIDCSGRVFENISAFEYALWALDQFMWETLLQNIPQNEEGKEILKILIAQYQKVKTEGVTYTLSGKTITESHFDYQNTIIKELQTQVNLVTAPGARDWALIDKQWKEDFGGALTLLPMHFVFSYCSEVPFYPIPDFTIPPQKPSNEFYDSDNKQYVYWFAPDSQLGKNIAVFRGPRKENASSATGQMMWGMPGMDLDALTKLCKVRTNALVNLEQQLLEQVKAIDVQPHI